MGLQRWLRAVFRPRVQDHTDMDRSGPFKWFAVSGPGEVSKSPERATVTMPRRSENGAGLRELGMTTAT